MGTKLTKKSGIKPKSQIETPRTKQVKPVKPVKKIVKKQPVQEEKEEEEKEEQITEEQKQDELEENFGGLSSTDDSDESEDEDVDVDSEEEEEEEKVIEEEAVIKTTKDSHQVKSLLKQANKNSRKEEKITKGVIYIGRLPEGFEEAELTKYFNQFGDIVNINLPRNKKTGRSKHFGFLEFSNIDDAKVAQETMNNYLLLNHQLKVTIVDDEFKSSRKFKKNYFKINKLTKDVEILNKNVETKRNKRREALKAAGIDF